ncbi:MAG TPA: AMP-binding protein [Capsulimonadaceae bacterium]
MAKLLANVWLALIFASVSLMVIAIVAVGAHAKAVFAGLGLLSLGVSILLLKIMPRESIRSLFAALLRVLYRVEVEGLENLAAAGPNAVIVANHQSLADGLLLGTFLPGNPVFAIDPIAAAQWYARPIVALVDTAQLNPLQPMSVRHLVQIVKSGRQCVIFPEGRLTETGGLMKIYPGPAMIAAKSDAPVVPVRIDGIQYTPFSRLGGTLPRRWFPKVTITILPAQRMPDTSQLVGAARRAAMTDNLYDLMAGMMIKTQPRAATLWTALLSARQLYGGKSPAVEDAKRSPVSYDGLVTSAHALGACFEQFSKPGERVGLFLPTGIAGVASFFALQSIGRCAAMLNYSAGAAALGAGCEAAEIKTVVTAREFIEKGKLHSQLAALERHCKIVYLEDLKAQITVPKKLVALLKTKLGWISDAGKKARPNDIAVVLFTSGSEGLPKGVALSHGNLLSNVEQIRTTIAYNPKDIIFNALPIFHAFGLTGGVLVPVLHGVKAFLHPTPLQYRIVPELVYHSNATIMFGTDTFLNGYARAGNAYDLYKVRLIVAGAEKVRPETLKLYAEKFGVPIYEGYGVTECAPAVTLNTPMRHRPGTVGRFVPDLEYRFVPVPGVEHGAQLWVKGPNVMQGYFKAEKPGVLQPLEDGWYDTGDIVSMDASGYVSILGRAKRFAKIGGEMVSLAAVEAYALSCWPSASHAIVNLPDARKGEVLLLATTEANATQSDLAKFMRSNGATDLSIPKSVVVVKALPLLGSGKTDYVGLKAMLAEPGREGVVTA